MTIDKRISYRFGKRGYHGSSRKSSRSSGPGPGGQGARGQATQNPGRGGGWSPGVGGKQHQPKTKTKTKTGGWTPGAGKPTHIPKKKTTTWTPGAGKPTHIPKKKTVTPPRFKDPQFLHNLKLKSIAARNQLRQKPGWKELMSQGLRSFTQQPRYIPWGLNKYIEGSTPGMAKIWAGTEKIPTEFSKYRTKGLANLDDLWKSITGKIPLGKYNLPTGSEGVHVATKPGVASGYASKWSDPLRGTKWATKTGELLKGEIPTKFLNQSRNMWGQIQSIIPAEVANKALLGKNVNLSNVKNIAKPVSKFMTRAVPVAGGAVSAADAAYRASKGDVLGATLSGASAVPGWGLVPLAAQVGTDWLGLTGPKTYKAQGGIVNLFKNGGFLG